MSGVLQDAAAFLGTVLPWPSEQSRFYINIHRRVPLVGQDKKPILDAKGVQRQIYPGKACLDATTAANYVGWANELIDGTEKGTDIYVCMSGQSEAKEKTNARGRISHQAVRLADNAVAFKGLWVDVDVKPDDLAKGYKDTTEAVQEFARIYKLIGLPAPTTCVLSGSGGFHAHWVFTEVVDAAQWEPLAHKLVAALNAHGFRGDTGCTIDAVRLLRVPQTWNHKQLRAGTGPKLPVQNFTPVGNTYIYDAIAKILEPWQVASYRSVTKAPFVIEGTPIYVTDDGSLSEGVSDRTTIPITLVADACPFVKRSLSTGGKDNNNPLWMATCRIALFTSEGRDAAHWMAAGHPGYAAGETDEMFERVTAERASRNLGWPQCKNIAAQGAPECLTCPHAQQGKSPFNWVVNPIQQAIDAAQAAPQVDPAAVAAMATLPRGYSYGPHGTIYKVVQDEDGAQHKQRICALPFLKPWMQEHPASFNFTTVTGGIVGGADEYRRQVKFPLEALYETSAFAKVLANQHMVVPKEDIPELGRFMVSWIESLREEKDSVVQSSPFGWYRKDGGIQGFIFGKRVFSDKPDRPASNPDPVLERHYSPTGTITPWMIASKMITDQKRPALDAILASSFAAPLVTLVGQTGLLMATYSKESGIGKSTTMKVAQAVWGHPIKAVQSLSDTQNSVLKKLGDTKNLPMYWDELKRDEDVRKFVQLAFQLAQGKEKSRMTSQVTYHEPGSWETLLCATSNNSIIDYITGQTRTTSAGLARVFEFTIPPPSSGGAGQISPATAQQITAALTDNYGHAGLIYARFLGRNFERIAQEVDAKLHAYEEAHQVTSEERFWLALLTVITMGAKYANETGLCEIDEAALEKFMVEKFYEMRGERKEAPVDIDNPITLLGHLARYLNEKRARNTITTNYVYKAAGRPPVHPNPNGVQLKEINNRVEEVLVHFGVDQHQLRIAKEPFGAWLDEAQLPRRLIFNQFKLTYGMVETRGRLGAGTPYGGHAEAVLDFDLKHPAFGGVFV
jgi:hypothetical protein